MKIFSGLTFFFAIQLISMAQPARPLYKDAKQPVAVRVKDLLSRMTLEEKVAQTLCVWNEKTKLLSDTNGQFNPQKAQKSFPHGLGQVARPSDRRPDLPYSGFTPSQTAAFTNKVQKYFVEKTRLGIPVVFHEEGLHGQQARNATNFPQSIALASTWDEKMLEQIFSAVALEIRSRGGHQVLAPVVDVARDPRWGRFEETYGEDPYLVSRMGVAAVKGFQGDIAKGIDNRHVLATLKHLTGHGQPEAGNNVAPANVGERTLREMFLPPFKACIQEAGAGSVMASYNEVDGIPSHASHFLLNQVLRQEWGFTGYVVSDYFAINELQARHRISSDSAESARKAMLAGVDVETPDAQCFPYLQSLITAGKLSPAVLDTAVARVLKYKFILGLFENPYVKEAEADKIVGSAAHVALAREAARKSVVLLKNNQNILPLAAGKYPKIAVIGPNAHKVLLGGYSDKPKYAVTLLDGIKAKVGKIAQVLYSEGCSITTGGNWFQDSIPVSQAADDRRKIEEAVKTASGADVVILAIGSDEKLSREAWAESHLGDRPSIELFGLQNELFDRLKALGKPIVVTLFNGGPLAVQNQQKNADAVLECWYLGQESGHAVADVLFGEYNPGGKLPCTFPRSAGHVPAFYNYKPTARRGYHFEDVSPLYPFGYGLSYTTFAYEKPVLAKTSVRKNETATVSVRVKNTGRYAGDEVVQLYIRDLEGSVTRPVKELKGFKRIHLKPNETATVTFDITPDHLAMWDVNMKYVVEPGAFEIMVGTSSDDKDLQKVSLTVQE